MLAVVPDSLESEFPSFIYWIFCLIFLMVSKFFFSSAITFVAILGNWLRDPNCSESHTPQTHDSKQLGKITSQCDVLNMFSFVVLLCLSFIYECFVRVCHLMALILSASISTNREKKSKKSIDSMSSNRLTPYQQTSIQSVRQTPKTIQWKNYSVRWPTIKWKLAGPN